jgi:hypothetical protein
MNLTELVDVAAATVSYHCYILYYMDLNEWLHVAAATVSYHCYILYYMDLTEWVTEYNNDKKLYQLLHELIQ